MLLQRLRDYSTRMDEGELGPPMYKPVAIKYQIELDRDGNYLGLVMLAGDPTRRTDRGQRLMAPTRVRSSGIQPLLYADNGEYTLGRARDPAKAARVADCHAAYIALTTRCAEVTGEAGARAVAMFYASTDMTALELPDDFDPAAGVTFAVDGARPIDQPEVQQFWAEYAGVPDDSDTALAQCLICGQARPPVERLQLKITGTAIPGGQSSGMSLISANADAFESYGLKASLVSPVCQDCSERFSKSLNALLASRPNHVAAPPLVYAFWTRDESEDDLASLFTDPDPGTVRALINAPLTAAAGATGLDANPFYAVALSASGGRVVVRDWMDSTLKQVLGTMRRYFVLQHLATDDGESFRPLRLRELTGATVRDYVPGARAEEPAPGVAQALLHMALAGGPLPLDLLARVLQRLRAGNRLSTARVALVKMVLLSERPDNEEMTMTQLDPTQSDPAYLCGRLLEVLDRIQQVAISPKATIVDRFFGTASSAPATVFGRLVRGAQPHLATLHRDRPAIGAALERRLARSCAASRASRRH